MRIHGTKRDFAGMEARRKRAAKLFDEGATQAEVARTLRVSAVSAHRWHRLWSRGGAKALRAAGRAGRLPRLSAKQLDGVRAALIEGPQAHGFTAALWTLPRVARLIERQTGVRYHEGHVWKILRGALGFSLQRPARRASQRDEAAIAQWRRRRLPAIKKKPVGGGRGSSSRMKAG